jgi:hypothetical protein
MNKLLAVTIEAISIVFGQPNIKVRQCPLLLKKWLKMVVAPMQIVLGLFVDTNKTTVGITKEYQDQVRVMLQKNWTSKHRFF